MLGLYIAGIVLTYLLGIFGLSYLHGRMNPFDEMEGIEIAGVIFWPICAVLAVPVCGIGGVIFGITYVADKMKEKGAAPAKVAREEARRQQQISREINNLQFFEDESTGIRGPGFF